MRLNRPNKETSMRFVFVALSLCLVGCAGTVAPNPVEPNKIGWDGNRRDAGIVKGDSRGVYVTERYVFVFNYLANKSKLHPPLGDVPLQSWTSYGRKVYLISGQQAQQFESLDRWAAENKVVVP